MSARRAMARREIDPIDALLDALPSLPRPTLEQIIERAIECLDGIDGDSDFEGSHDEDDINTAFFMIERDGPGCPLSDPGGQADEDDCNTGTRKYGEHGQSFEGAGCPISDPGEMSCRRMLQPTYDGEDQTVIVMPAQIGAKPYRFHAS